MTAKKLFYLLLLLLVYYLTKQKNIKQYFIISSIITFLSLLENQINNSGGKLYFTENLRNNSIINRCPSFKNKTFTPSFFFQNCILQSFIASVLPTNKNLYFEKETIIDPEGKIVGVTLDWPTVKYQKFKIKLPNVLIFILPGLTGQAYDSYINNLCYYLLKKGYQSVVYNYRLLTQELKITEEPIVLNNDINLTLQQIKKKYPQFQYIYAIGHSYGANSMVNYLGQEKYKSLINGAVSIANPFCMNICSKQIKETLNDRLLCHFLKSKFEKNKQIYIEGAHKRNLDIEKAQKAIYLYDFTEAITRRIHGFPTVELYYRQISCFDQILNVKVPMLAINSQDDVAAHKLAFPIDEFILNQNLIFYETNSGGHVGWVEGLFSLNVWYYKPALEYIEALIEDEVKNY